MIIKSRRETIAGRLTTLASILTHFVSHFLLTVVCSQAVDQLMRNLDFRLPKLTNQLGDYPFLSVIDILLRPVGILQ